MTGEEKIAHLQMIQGVINRMAGNSFSLKTVGVTLTAASVAYYGAVVRASWLVAAGVWLALAVLWGLDAKYLQLERQFRKLYDAVRVGTHTEAFSMDFRNYVQDVQSVRRIAFSWSVLWIYGALAVFLALLIVVRPAP